MTMQTTAGGCFYFVEFNEWGLYSDEAEAIGRREDEFPRDAVLLAFFRRGNDRYVLHRVFTAEELAKALKL